jgi:hypothetical protein
VAGAPAVDADDRVGDGHEAQTGTGA